MPKKITKYDYFEVLDRIHMMDKFFHESLVKHPLLKKEKSLSNKVNKISELLGELYQEAGGLFFDIDESDK